MAPSSPETNADINPADDPVDSARPFLGITVCCTSIAAHQRTDIANKVAELGGVHKYDLTHAVTHLIVGDYNTPKYRHVAKERPDVKVMDPQWVFAVSELWREDSRIDLAALERAWQLRPLETAGGPPEQAGMRSSVLVCMTGFGKEERKRITQRILDNGGRFTADLSKAVTHLVAHQPVGKKYDAARLWGVHTVNIAWLDQSIERGMMLDEKCFDPTMPPHQIGKGAWNRRASTVVLGKRSRGDDAGGGGGGGNGGGNGNGGGGGGGGNGGVPGAAAGVGPGDAGARKLRKTASMRMLGEGGGAIWGDIVSFGSGGGGAVPGGSNGEAPDGTGPRESLPSGHQVSSDQTEQKQVQVQPQLPARPAGIFSDCFFFLSGFNDRKRSILAQTVVSLAGSVCDTIESAALQPSGPPRHGIVVVAQDSQPDSHPQLFGSLHIVTEFWVEKCMHNKRFLHPDSHVLGRPFPLFPIPGFDALTLCSAGFSGIELHHVARATRQLGARFQERFGRDVGVLVCKSLESVRPEKLRLALTWGVPLVSEEWLWECIATGYDAPVDGFVFRQLGQKAPGRRQNRDGGGGGMRRVQSDPVPGQSVARKADAAKPSASESPEGAAERSRYENRQQHPHEHARQQPDQLHDSNVTSFATALTRQPSNPVLAETSPNVWPMSPRKQPKSRVQTRPEEDNSAPAPAARSAGPDGETESSRNPGETGAKRGVAEKAKTELPSRRKAEAAEEVRRRRAEEKQRERLALSNKLNSLLDSAAAAGPAGSVGSAGGLGSGSGPERASTASSDGHRGEEDSQPPSRPARKRQIFGRALSNVSASSAGGGGAGDGGGGGGGGSATTTVITITETATTTTTNEAADFEGDETGNTSVASVGPDVPSTQIEYRDKKADEYREALLQRMMGGDKDGNRVPGRAERNKRRTKSLAQLGRETRPIKRQEFTEQ